MPQAESSIAHVRRLVGPITPEQLRFVDQYAGEHTVLFMPAGGACFFALSPRHSHPSYMFVLAFDDHTALVLNGAEIVVQPGKVLALSPGIEHHELPSDIPPRYIAAFIDPKLFEAALALYPQSRKLALAGEYYEAPAELLPLLKRFMIEAGQNAPGAGAVLNAISIELCHVLVRAIIGIGGRPCRIAQRLEIDRVVQFIQANLRRKITVQGLAQVACLSVPQFNRVFKKELGISPYEYLLRIRLRRARKLILAGGHSITDIAFLCGFNSPSHLSSLFAKRFGISPAAYKQEVGPA